jgi:4-hydroxy-tetrahydrodipicolinate reductase
MGGLACDAVRAADGLDLAAEIRRGDPLDPLQACDVVVEFTHPGVVMDHIAWCVDHRLHVVVGTSGFTEERFDRVRNLLGDEPAVGVVVVPNFSIGAVLMMHFAAEAARYFESVEIVEMHHAGKVDAPSGTALRTASLVADARRSGGCGEPPDATRNDDLGARGGRAEGIPVHSLRLRGAVAHQEVVLGNAGELLSIRHDMLDRAAAMPGVVSAVRAVSSLPGLTVGLERVLWPDRCE